MTDVERGEIVADRRHHHLDRFGAHDRQPFGLRLPCQRVAILRGKRRADRLEIIARIKPFRDGADVLAERFAVAQIGRARELIDLRAGIVDVIFARHLEAGEGQQVGQRIAEHGAAAMADMHRPGRIGRDIFDIDRHAARRYRSLPYCAPSCTALRSASIHAAGLSVRLMKPGPATSTLATRSSARSLSGDRFGKLARLAAGILGEHHGGIGRDVAMRRIARRLDRHARLIDAGRQHAGGNQRVVRAADAIEHFGENVVCGHDEFEQCSAVGAPRA